MTGPGVMMTLIICFALLPMWQLYRYDCAGRKRITWNDVGWLLAYFAVGFTVLYKLRPVLMGFGVS